MQVKLNLLIAIFMPIGSFGQDIKSDIIPGDSVQSALITLNVITPVIPDTELVYIAGNHSLLGHWAPDRVPLKRLDKDQWQINFWFPLGSKLEYKITRGSWYKEAVDQHGNIPDNYQLYVKTDTAVTHQIFAWRDNFERLLPGKVTGNYRVHSDLSFPGLKPRNVIVWLPPGYDSEPQRRYPVLYMHDGQNILDPMTSTFGHDWQIDETADSLIKQQLIEPLIVVGIYNTIDRAKEYAPGDLGRRYMDFVVGTVKPFIDSTYRTMPARLFTATGGSSQGGLIAFMLLWERPDVVSMAACLSPAFRFNTTDYTSFVRRTSGPDNNICIYFDNGSMGLDSLLQPQLDEMVNALTAKGLQLGKQLFVFIDPDGQHSEIYWAKRFWRPLTIFWGANED